MRKVAIVGGALTSQGLAPYDDESWEIWGLNEIPLPRVDRMFELHTWDKVSASEKVWLTANTTVPVYMHHPVDDVSMAVRYPSEAIRKEFPSYFTSSVPWMIALAIYEGVDELAVYGVDAFDDEHVPFRAAIEYFIGVATGRGIPVYVPPEADILKCRFQYGLETPMLLENLDARLKELTEKSAHYAQEQLQASLNKAFIEGALEIVGYMRKTWGGLNNG